MELIFFYLHPLRRPQSEVLQGGRPGGGRGGLGAPAEEAGSPSHVQWSPMQGLHSSPNPRPAFTDCSLGYLQQTL